jgi:hypothetical protein
MKKALIIGIFSVLAFSLSAETRSLVFTPCEYLNGLGIGLIGSVVAKDVNGAQLSTGFNLAGGDVRGIQAAAGFNMASGRFRGIQASTAFNMAGSVKGIQISSGINLAGDVIGVQSALVNVAEDVSVAQMGLVNVAEDVSVAQIGLVNVAEDISVAQIGLVNVAEEARFMQVGLVNIARDVRIPIGLINIVEEGQSHIDLTYDEVGFVNLTLGMGGRSFYNAYSLGVRDDGGSAMLALGFGWRRSKGLLFIDTEASFGTVRPLDEGFFQESPNLLSKAKLSLGMNLIGGLSLIGGVSYNAFLTYGETELEVGPKAEFQYLPELHGAWELENHRLVTWPGLFLGIEL